MKIHDRVVTKLKVVFYRSLEIEQFHIFLDSFKELFSMLSHKSPTQLLGLVLQNINNCLKLFFLHV